MFIEILLHKISPLKKDDQGSKPAFLCNMLRFAICLPHFFFCCLPCIGSYFRNLMRQRFNIRTVPGGWHLGPH